jgi:LmbE family N-acetylglucosaminyl deacetylase
MSLRTTARMAPSTPMTGPDPGLAVARLLVVVAHPDDETFGCGSVLALAAERGVQTVVACATRGEAGEPAPGCGIDPADLAHAREAELRRAADLLGVSRVQLFDWTDSGMAGDPPAGSLAAAPLDDVADAIAALIEDVRPDVVLTLDASDGHRDHAHVRDATLAAVDRSASRPPQVYLQCLARSLMDRWITELRARHPGSDHLALGQLGTPDDEITTVVDTARHEELRWRAIRAHASQASPFEVMPPDLQRQFLAVDRLRRVRPPWMGGPLEQELFG